MFVIFISIILRFNQTIEILVVTTWILHPWIFRWKFLWRYKKIVKCVCQYIRNKCQSQTSLTLKWILCLQSYRPYTSEKLSNWCGSPLFLFCWVLYFANVKKSSFPLLTSFDTKHDHSTWTSFFEYHILTLIIKEANFTSFRVRNFVWNVNVYLYLQLGSKVLTILHILFTIHNLCNKLCGAQFELSSRPMYNVKQRRPHFYILHTYVTKVISNTNILTFIKKPIHIPDIPPQGSVFVFCIECFLEHKWGWRQKSHLKLKSHPAFLVCFSWRQKRPLPN